MPEAILGHIGHHLPQLEAGVRPVARARVPLRRERKGTSACELGISFETSYAALWHNLMKLRGAMASRRQAVYLEGTIEMDAAWFGGKVRKKNKQADRQLKEHDRPMG